MPAVFYSYPINLTRYFISSIIKLDSEMKNKNTKKMQPILEVFHINRTRNPNNNHINNNVPPQFNYCMVISDGASKAPVFISENLNHFIESGAIQKGSIIKLLDYEPFVSNHLKTIRVTKMEILFGSYDATKGSAFEKIAPFNDSTTSVGVTVPIRSASPLLNSSSTDQATLVPMIPESNGVSFTNNPVGVQNMQPTIQAPLVAMVPKSNGVSFTNNPVGVQNVQPTSQAPLVAMVPKPNGDSFTNNPVAVQNIQPTSQASLVAMVPKSNGDSLTSQPIGAHNILTSGAISMIAQGKKSRNLIVQVVYTFQSTEDIHLMLISDGLHMQIAMLAPPMNHLILLKQLKKGTIVQLVDYICPTVHNGMKMIVINMEVRIKDYEVLGEPKLYVEAIPRLNDAKQESANETSFFMHQPRLAFPNHQTQDVYRPNHNNAANKGPIGPPNRDFEVASFVREIEHLQLEVNRVHLEMRHKQEKHEIEVSRLKSDILQQRKQSEFQINAMKKELEAAKKMIRQEDKDIGLKGDAGFDASETNFEGLDQELERIWL